MSKWNQETIDIKLTANYIPSFNDAWGKTGSCIVHAENPLTFSKKLPKNKLYNLITEVYTPKTKFNLDEGELEHILCKINENSDSFAYELRTLEIPGKNFRKLYSYTAIAFTIGLVSVYTWWWLFFITPYWLASGIENKNKNKVIKNLPNYNKRIITLGKDNKKIESINEVCDFYNNLKEEDYLRRLQLTRDFCKKKGYKELAQGYRDLLEANLEDSWILKKLPYTFFQQVKDFILNPRGLVPAAEVPKQLINVRDLNDKTLERYL